METIRTDVAIIGAGGAGLRAAIALAEAGVVFLSLWSAAHRLRITCYDLGIRADTVVATIVYAGALAGTGASVLYFARI